MKITIPMYFFSTFNLLNEREFRSLQRKYDYCAFFIADRAILAFACAKKKNVVMIMKDLQKNKAYKNEKLDPNTIQRY